MFTAESFQRIRSRCLPEFESLLNRLDIKVNWRGDDEFRIYDRLDTELTEKLCGLMKSRTIVEGYMSLLDLGGVTYDVGKYDELLGNVVANKDKILRGLENMPKLVEVESLSQQQPLQPMTQTNYWKMFGVIFILLGAIGLFLFGYDLGILSPYMQKASGIGGAALIIGGIISLWKGKNSTLETKTAAQPVNQAPARKEVKPPFTRNELQKALDVLAQVDKIVRAI